MTFVANLVCFIAMRNTGATARLNWSIFLKHFLFSAKNFDFFIRLAKMFSKKMRLFSSYANDCRNEETNFKKYKNGRQECFPGLIHFWKVLARFRSVNAPFAWLPIGRTNLKNEFTLDSNWSLDLKCSFKCIYLRHSFQKIETPWWFAKLRPHFVQLANRWSSHVVRFLLCRWRRIHAMKCHFQATHRSLQISSLSNQTKAEFSSHPDLLAAISSNRYLLDNIQTN